MNFISVDHNVHDVSETYLKIISRAKELSSVARSIERKLQTDNFIKTAVIATEAEILELDAILKDADMYSILSKLMRWQEKIRQRSLEQLSREELRTQLILLPGRSKYRTKEAMVNALKITSP